MVLWKSSQVSLVLVRPHIGGYVVAAWLTAIALQFTCRRIYVDVAVRDLVMAIAAYSMGKNIKKSMKVFREDMATKVHIDEKDIIQRIIKEKISFLR